MIVSRALSFLCVIQTLNTLETQTFSTINIAFIIQKNRQNIVVQSCKSSEVKAPRVLEYSNGSKRKHRRSRMEIATDKNPASWSIHDIIKWICAKDQLELTYHVAEANCQHFSSSLWNGFASFAYPIPAKYGKYKMHYTANIYYFGTRNDNECIHAGHTRKASRISKTVVENCDKGVGNF